MNRVIHRIMNKILKSTLLFLFASLILVGCKNSILTDEPGDLSSKNVRLRIFSYWNNHFFSTDSLYFTGGAFVKIDDISIVHSNYFFVNDGDTLPKSDVAEWKHSTGSDLFLASLEVGSYTGFYKYLIGLDSLTNSRNPDYFKEGHPLTNPSLYRGPGKGYNFVTITGKIQDPNKPNSEPSIPLRWVVATNDLTFQLGQAKSFNVVAGKNITYDVILNVADLVDGIFPIVTPIIECDPAKPNDFNQAMVIYQNLVQGAYNLQL